MLFVVQFIDDPKALAIRERHLEAHIEWLRERKGYIHAAGSLRQQPGDAAKGGLWIVEADNKQAVEDIICTDPFSIHGLRASYSILHYSKAFEDRKV